MHNESVSNRHIGFTTLEDKIDGKFAFDNWKNVNMVGQRVSLPTFFLLTTGCLAPRKVDRSHRASMIFCLDNSTYVPTLRRNSQPAPAIFA
jgi:hypothetical protein